MSLKSLVPAAFAVVVLASCGKDRVQVSDNGLKYQIHEQNENARKAKVGDIVTLHLILKNGKDSVLRDTHKEGTPLDLPLQVPAFKGAFEEGLAMLGKGDSATFYVSADSLFGRAMQPMPPGITKGSDIAFNVKIVDVRNEEQFRKARQQAMERQKGIDEKIITAYLTKNGLAEKAVKTPNGVYFTVSQGGTGGKPNPGDMVKVHYTGKLLDGKVFDSSVQKGQPLEMPIGVGQVIPGWDEGVMQLRKGTKATLYIPSVMAYGPQGSPPVIPANAVLVFDIDMIDIRKGQMPMNMPGAPGAPAPSAPGGN